MIVAERIGFGGPVEFENRRNVGPPRDLQLRRIEVPGHCGTPPGTMEYGKTVRVVEVEAVGKSIGEL